MILNAKRGFRYEPSHLRHRSSHFPVSLRDARLSDEENNKRRLKHWDYDVWVLVKNASSRCRRTNFSIIFQFFPAAETHLMIHKNKFENHRG